MEDEAFLVPERQAGCAVSLSGGIIVNSASKEFSEPVDLARCVVVSHVPGQGDICPLEELPVSYWYVLR